MGATLRHQPPLHELEVLSTAPVRRSPTRLTLIAPVRREGDRRSPPESRTDDTPPFGAPIKPKDSVRCRHARSGAWSTPHVETGPHVALPFSFEVCAA